MRLKNEDQRARIHGVQPETLFAMMVFREVWFDFKLGNFTITSVTEGRHTRGSEHYQGFAFDIRTRGVTTVELSKVVADAVRRLGPDYRVILESNHIHVGYNPQVLMP